jgi:hypothetical protein
VGCLTLLGLGGCAADKMDSLVQALNERGVSNCLEIHGAYLGQSITLYGRAGDLDCIALWTGGRVMAPQMVPRQGPEMPACAPGVGEAP